MDVECPDGVVRILVKEIDLLKPFPVDSRFGLEEGEFLHNREEAEAGEIARVTVDAQAARCEQAGRDQSPRAPWIHRRSKRGSHVVLKGRGRTFVVPLHSELDRGTLRTIIREANVSIDEFVDVL